MKKLILVFAAIVITAGAYAQTDSTNMKLSQNNTNKNQNMQNNPVDKSYKDGVIMHNGKMMKVKNGQTTSFDKDITMSNGTKMMSNGTYIKKDGTRMTMKEGQQMDMSGNIIPMKTIKDNNMYIVPDSTMKNNK